jgi:hypothetical protein
MGWLGFKPEDLQNGLAVGHHLVLLDECVSIDGHGVPLHAEVTAKFHVEAHLQWHSPSTDVNVIFKANDSINDDSYSSTTKENKGNAKGN